MLRTTIQYDTKGLNEALKQYLDIRKNVNPKKEIRRRAKNVGMRLIKIYKKAAPTKADIKQKIQSLGFHVKIRGSIRTKGGGMKGMIKAELRARQNATTFTATGWFPAVIQLGGSPRKKNGVRGTIRGTLVENVAGANLSETLINLQPGAAQTADRAGNALQKAIEQERDDMILYINRKLAQAANSAGLATTLSSI